MEKPNTPFYNFFNAITKENYKVLQNLLDNNKVIPISEIIDPFRYVQSKKMIKFLADWNEQHPEHGDLINDIDMKGYYKLDFIGISLKMVRI